MQGNDYLTHLLVEFYERFSSWEHEVVRGDELSLPQMHAVEVLGAHGGLRMKDLATRMGVTTGTLTVLVDRLESKGVVERRPHETDRRSYIVALTDAGRTHFARHHKLHLDFTRELTADLDEPDLAKLAELFEKMLERF